MSETGGPTPGRRSSPTQDRQRAVRGVGQRGWTPQRYERFLADTWRRLLLAD